MLEELGQVKKFTNIQSTPYLAYTVKDPSYRNSRSDKQYSESLEQFALLTTAHPSSTRNSTTFMSNLTVTTIINLVRILRSARLTKQRRTDISEDHKLCKKCNRVFI